MSVLLLAQQYVLLMLIVWTLQAAMTVSADQATQGMEDFNVQVVYEYLTVNV